MDGYRNRIACEACARSNYLSPYLSIQAPAVQAPAAAPALGPSGFLWAASLVDRAGRWKNKLTNNNTDVVRVNSAGSNPDPPP